MNAMWGDNSGITWVNAADNIKEAFALQRLYWFFRMVDSGGPDGSALDTEVYDQAREASEWFGPIFEARTNTASDSRD